MERRADSTLLATMFAAMHENDDPSNRRMRETAPFRPFERHPSRGGAARARVGVR